MSYRWVFWVNDEWKRMGYRWGDGEMVTVFSLFPVPYC
ncbi:hypothetical protein L8106_14300 [Lyngbya sp. PCC 8106]|nr:hypothetical protein L8106_14300 [Lyngbya sp. PCC 8106]